MEELHRSNLKLHAEGPLGCSKCRKTVVMGGCGTCKARKAKAIADLEKLGVSV